MQVDHALVAAAEALAGADVHQVRQKLTIYATGIETLQRTGSEDIRQSAQEAERWLRAFVARARMRDLRLPKSYQNA